MPKENENKEEGEQINIGTILRYIVDNKDSPVPPPQVVLANNLLQDLQQHIDIGEQVPLALTSEHLQSVEPVASTSAGVPARHDPSRLTSLHRSLHQRIGTAGNHHVLNPNLSWEDFAAETENGFTTGRTDPLSRSVRFIKPIYSSYVNLINISLSDTSSESVHSDQSGHTAAPLQGILNNLGIDNIDWDEIEVQENNIVLVNNIENNAPSEHNDASADTIDMDDISDQEVPDHDQLLIDIDHPRLIDNPRDAWWVSDLPPSPNRTRSESSESRTSSKERRRRREEQRRRRQERRDNEKNPDDRDEDPEPSPTPTPTESSVVRPTRPVLVPPLETENTLDRYLDFVPNINNSIIP